VAVEDDLRRERRVPGHLDRHVPPQAGLGRPAFSGQLNWR
jgi:hypothetical protein